LSSLHTNSAAGTVARLVDMKAEPFLLTSTLSVIVAQRLIRCLHESKEKYFLDKKELDSISEIVDLDRIHGFLLEEKIIEKNTKWGEIPFYRPKPSAETEDGYKGRVGIHEVLKVTPAIEGLIMKGATTEEIEEQAKKEGMVTMIEDGIFKAVQGTTSVEEILRVVSE
jgi:type II secretory ATPase GspE/PulE/Tfp pilus assembly ATPase PilB-like protein